MKPLRLRFAGSLVLALMLAACDGGMDGTFQDELGVSRYEFKPDGKVYMSTMGMTFAGTYEIDQDRITVEGPNGAIVLRRDGDSLNGPMGLVLHRVAQD